MAERNKAYEDYLEGKDIETANEPIAESMTQDEVEADILKKAEAAEAAASAEVLKDRFNPLTKERDTKSGKAKRLSTNAEWKNTTRKNKKEPIRQGTEWFGMDKSARERAAAILQAGKDAQKKMNLVTKNSRTELRKLEKEVADLDVKVAATQKEIDEITPKKEVALSEVTKFQGQVTAAEKELAEAKQEFKKKEAQKKIDAAKGKLTLAEGAVSTLDKSLSFLEERLAAEKVEVAEASGRLEEKEKALKIIQKNATKVEAALIKAKQMNAVKSLKKKGQNQKTRAAANKKALEKLEAATAAANATPEINENALEEEASAKRIAAAKEKAKALIEKSAANLKVANEKARAEGKPVVSEPAYVQKPVELNEEETPEPFSEAVHEPPSEPAPEVVPEAVASEATPPTELPPGWEEHRNNEGQVYYSNGTTTQWERPNVSSVSNTKSTENSESQLAEEKAALDAQVSELKAAKEAAEAQLAELKAAKEAAEAQVTELKAAKEAAEAQLTELKAAKEAAEAQVTELKAAKESIEVEIAALKVAKEANKSQEETSEPTNPTSNSNSNNTNSNNPQPSDEEKIHQILKNGEDGFPPLKLPDTPKTNFEHAIKPFYDKMVSDPNQAYVELYVKLYVFCYAIKQEKIPDGDLFEEGTKTDLTEFLSDEIKKQVKITPYYDLMFRLGVSQFYKESLTDTLHIVDNLDKIDLTLEE
jgi:chromosome segregation ATPase